MATTTPADLPDSVEELRALVLRQRTEYAQQKARLSEEKAQLEQRLEETIAEYRAENERLAEYVRLLKSHRFGRSSERSDHPDQPQLFNEAEVLADASAAEEEAIEVPAHRRRRGGRRPLPDSLPRVEVLRDLDESEKVCRNDPDHALARLGEERAERLVYRPAELYVEIEIRPKYACGTCKDHVAGRAPSPQPIPKSLASASLLAQIATAKYVDGLPLARQEKILARLGIDLPRATLASWMVRCGELVARLTDLLLERIREAGYVLADETPFQVLKEKGHDGPPEGSTGLQSSRRCRGTTLGLLRYRSVSQGPKDGRFVLRSTLTARFANVASRASLNFNVRSRASWLAEGEFRSVTTTTTSPLLFATATRRSIHSVLLDAGSTM